jgi:hypothetical protein
LEKTDASSTARTGRSLLDAGANIIEHLSGSCFSSRMKTIPKIPRGPPKPVCVIKEEPYYDVPSAARIIKVVCPSTLRRWTVKGWSSFGLSLDVVRRNGHLLLPELKVMVLKEFLEDHPLPRPNAPSGDRMTFLKAVKGAMFEYIRPRTGYSRARNPHPFQR